MRKSTRLPGLLTLVLLIVCPTLASAQSEVSGSGVYRLDNATDGVIYLGHIAVSASLDESGAASGWIAWQGDYTFGVSGVQPGGPAYPYLIDVTDIEFFAPGTVPGVPANRPVAVVGGILVSSPVHEDEGGYWQFLFQDNTGTDDPDVANAAPVIAGNIIIR